ncbi:hypothetical protein [Falsiroseomonas sp. E2-1-a20]|uniref:hypothetical protein n=1 Tax=Falsiroseomonas sp. E2-1-a20 TaxID=3239300 RepID=UPI003F36B0FC
MRSWTRLSAAAALLASVAVTAQAQTGPTEMSFFITSANPGRGGDLGGLAGADAHCQSLAQAAGAGGRTWRAYLSTQGANAVNARDRIGSGPWRNARGEVIARSVADLHGETNNLTRQTALTERGTPVTGRGEQPNNHDILTGSKEDGTAFEFTPDRTCRSWTDGEADGTAMVGHHDRQGLRDDASSKSWNTSHPTRGCTMEAFRSTGGAGLFYCFAVN